MKVFLLNTVSADVASFGALPNPVWTSLGLLELVCPARLILPAALA